VRRPGHKQDGKVGTINKLSFFGGPEGPCPGAGAREYRRVVPRSKWLVASIPRLGGVRRNLWSSHGKAYQFANDRGRAA
jgi:hypothetical protein